MQVRALAGTYPAPEALEAPHDALAGIRADISAALDGLDTDPAKYHEVDRPAAHGNVISLPVGRA